MRENDSHFLLMSRWQDICGGSQLWHVHGGPCGRLLWEGSEHDRHLHRLPTGRLSHPHQPAKPQHPQGPMCTLWHGPATAGDRLWLPWVLLQWTKVHPIARGALFWPVAQDHQVNTGYCLSSTEWQPLGDADKAGFCKTQLQETWGAPEFSAAERLVLIRFQKVSKVVCTIQSAY